MDVETRFTLAICCYKFERFIDEALDGAFAQTYRPLEIVISDDNSPDGTWDRIKAKISSFVAEHKDVECRDLSDERFPQRIPPSSASLSIILNRNAENLGLARHENRLFELSHGDYIAFQSGDDVSMPDRIARIASAVFDNPRLRCLHCRTQVIDALGNEFNVPTSFLNEQIRSQRHKILPSILGAGAVYHKEVYSKFGPLGHGVANEDHVLPFRAEMLGDVYFTEEKLVKYRKHEKNASGKYSRNPDFVAQYRLRMIYTYYQELTDLHFAELHKIVEGVRARRYRKMIERQLNIMRFGSNWQLHPQKRVWLALQVLFFAEICPPLGSEGVGAN